MNIVNKFFLLFLITLCLKLNESDATFFDILNIFDESMNNENYFKGDILDVPNLIESYGYTAERHSVTTDDGYILEIHRIPNGKLWNNLSSSEEVLDYSTEERDKRHEPHLQQKSSSGEFVERKHRPVILLVHCVLCTSSIWVMQGPQKGLGFLLADEGFDVWMMNARGTSYGSKHVKYSSKTSKFWEFSWHEKGMYDAPATIDYILESTNHSKVTYIGYSMGTTIFFTMASSRPEYNDKIEKMIAMAPAVFIKGARGFLPNLSKHMNVILPLLKESKTTRIPNSYTYRRFLQTICDSSKLFMKRFCSLVLDFVGKIAFKKLDWDRLRYYFKFFPDYTSLNAITHYMQTKNADSFRLFDYGFEKNNEIYGEMTPPEYNLSQITTPVHMFYSRFDTITPAKGVSRLHSILPESYLYEIDIPYFSHAHFSWGFNCKEILYDNVIALLRDGDLKP